MLAHLVPLAAALTLALAQPEGAEPAPAEPGASEPAPAEPGPSEPPAAEPSTPTPAPPEGAAPKPPPAAASNEEAPDKKDNWIDVGHAFIEHRVFAPILRLDRFFSDERDLDAERSRSFLRWRNEVHFTEDATGPIFTIGVRANLRLPGLNQQLRRLRIVIAGETRDALRNFFPRRPGSSISDDEDTLGASNAGFRLYFLDTLVSHADVGAGVLTRIPPGLYSQLRLRTAIPVRKLFLTRQVVTGFWRTDTHFGTSAGVELERPLTRTFVSRINGSATLTEKSQGVEWASEVALFAFIDEQRAAQLALAVNGRTRPNLASDGVTRPPDLDRFRLYTRLRRDLYRRWIFVEIEPELAWTWNLERHRHPAWGVTFRLEAQFQGREAPPPPPPEPPPEPEDPPPPDALPR